MARRGGGATEAKESSDEPQSIVDVLRENTLEWRTRRNLTQEELGKACGIANTEIHRLEKEGRNFGVERVEKLARALGISESTLLRRKKRRAPNAQ
jgi:transcriptional regulator with XRE-family HTH domain